MWCDKLEKDIEQKNSKIKELQIEFVGFQKKDDDFRYLK
jgi:hypothetical protein